MTDDLRARIAAVLNRHKTDGDRYDEWSDCQCGHVGTRWDDHVADAVIRELPELGRIAKVTEVCMASLDLDSRTGTTLSDRQWLAETVLNVLSGAVDG